MTRAWTGGSLLAQTAAAETTASLGKTLGSQGADRLDRVPRGKEVRARVIESLHTPSQESRDKNSGEVQTV